LNAYLRSSIRYNEIFTPLSKNLNILKTGPDPQDQDHVKVNYNSRDLQRNGMHVGRLVLESCKPPY